MPTPDVQIPGVYNFRDLGGGTTAAGERVRTGVLYRSAALDRITNEGLATLAALRIRTVLDLRSRPEVDLHGRFPFERSSARWVNVPSSAGPPGPGTSPPGHASIVEHPDPLSIVFTNLVTSEREFIAEVLRFVADPSNQPLVFHCTSGKDRTGVIAALIQIVIGRSIDDVLVDFERSAEFRDQIKADVLARFAHLDGFPTGLADRISTVNRQWLLDALDLVGGPTGLDPWLDSIGVDAEAREALRRQMIE